MAKPYLQSEKEFILHYKVLNTQTNNQTEIQRNTCLGVQHFPKCLLLEVIHIEMKNPDSSFCKLNPLEVTLSVCSIPAGVICS